MFSASIGVNTHLDENWTVYANTTLVVGAVAYLGITKLRDSMASSADAPLFASVAATTGFKFDAYLSQSSFSYDGEIVRTR